MTYYHCSPVRGLKVLEPGVPKSFDKPAGVYLSTLLPMALMYGVRNFEYTYGYTRGGRSITRSTSPARWRRCIGASPQASTSALRSP